MDKEPRIRNQMPPLPPFLCVSKGFHPIRETVAGLNAEC
jgi:hypothetical protein